MASLVYALLWCLSLVPLRLLYVLSWAAAWVLRVGIRYRRKVVEDNLRACFPEASDHELHQWTKGYYRHLADVMVEMIKVASMSPNQLASRMKLDHDALGQSIYQGGKGGVIIASHYGNFEWLSLRCGSWLAEHGVPSAGIYARLSKGSWGKIILSLRAKWGMLLIPKHKALIKSLQLMKEGYIIGFMTDQAPPKEGPSVMIDFLGRPTAWMPAAAKLALRNGGPMLYADVERLGRGRYQVHLTELSVPENPRSAEAAEEVTRQYVKLLEARIKKDPAFWLWSHRRWK